VLLQQHRLLVSITSDEKQYLRRKLAIKVFPCGLRDMYMVSSRPSCQSVNVSTQLFYDWFNFKEITNWRSLFFIAFALD